jgi:hypothetical protein
MSTASERIIHIFRKSCKERIWQRCCRHCLSVSEIGVPGGHTATARAGVEGFFSEK